MTKRQLAFARTNTQQGLGVTPTAFATVNGDPINGDLQRGKATVFQIGL